MDYNGYELRQLEQELASALNRINHDQKIVEEVKKAISRKETEQDDQIGATPAHQTAP
ncbi:MAG: hypothetical protein WDZ64_00205 [Parcubacteria group bacterium]